MSLCYAEKYKNALFSELKMRVRTNPIPLDPSAIFDTYLEMEEYLAGPTSYAGQVIAVANGSIDISNGNKDYGLYIIRSDKSIQAINSINIFETKALANTWLANNIANVLSGSILSILEDGKYNLYVINTDKTLKKISMDDEIDNIESSIEKLSTRLNTLADSDDTTLDQLSEIVSYIKNNKSLIDGVTTSKVNVTDIVDNLTTAVSNKPLSANQGVELKKLIDNMIPITIDEINEICDMSIEIAENIAF